MADCHIITESYNQKHIAIQKKYLKIKQTFLLKKSLILEEMEANIESHLKMCAKKCRCNKITAHNENILKMHAKVIEDKLTSLQEQKQRNQKRLKKMKTD